MKKTIIYLLASLLLISMVAAASVTRELPTRADPNKEATIKLIITNAKPNELLTLEEELPQGIKITDWTIIGAKESKQDVKTRIIDNRFGWSFTPTASTATIIYKIMAGSANLNFGTLIYFDSSGQGKVDSQVLRVAPIVCGDKICEGTETTATCSADCPAPVTPVKKPVAQPPAPAKPVVKEEPEKKPSTLATVLVMIAIFIIIVLIIMGITKRKKPHHHHMIGEEE
jgi:hypothetical protein